MTVDLDAHVICEPFRFEIITLTNLPFKVKKKKSLLYDASNHRQSKTGVHTTVNGLGLVARLRKRRD